MMPKLRRWRWPLLLAIVVVAAVSWRFLAGGRAARHVLAGPRPDLLLEVSKQLQRRVTVRFDATPIGAAVAEISRKIGAPIRLDPTALADLGLTEEAPVSLALDDVSAATALDLLLESVAPEGLLFVTVRDGIATLGAGPNAPALELIELGPAAGLDGPDSMIGLTESLLAFSESDSPLGPASSGVETPQGVLLRQSLRANMLSRDLLRRLRDSPTTRGPQTLAPRSTSEQRARLRTTVKAQFFRVPVADALVELAHQARLRVFFDASVTEDPAFMEDPRVFMDCELPLEAAIRWLIQPLELDFAMDGNLLIFLAHDRQRLFDYRAYAIDDLLGQLTSEELRAGDLPEQLAQLSSLPERWRLRGGGGTLTLAPPLLIAGALSGAHVELERLLARWRQAAGLPGDSLPELELQDRVSTALRRDITAEYDGTLLAEAVRDVARRLEIPYSLNLDRQKFRTRVTGRIDSRPAGEALEALLPSKFTVSATPCGLSVVSSEAAPQSIEFFLPPRNVSFDELLKDDGTNLLSLPGFVSSDLWSDFGGAGEMRRLGRFVVARHHWRILERCRQTLQLVARAQQRGPREFAFDLVASDTDARRRREDLLDETRVTWDYQGSLQGLLDQVARTAGPVRVPSPIDLPPTIEVQLPELPLRIALQKVLATHSLAYDVDAAGLTVFGRGDLFASRDDRRRLRGFWGGDLLASLDADQRTGLVSFIVRSVASDRWDPSGGNQIYLAGDALIAENEPEVLRRVDDFLMKLRESTAVDGQRVDLPTDRWSQETLRRAQTRVTLDPRLSIPEALEEIERQTGVPTGGTQAPSLANPFSDEPLAGRAPRRALIHNLTAEEAISILAFGEPQTLRHGVFTRELWQIGPAFTTLSLHRVSRIAEDAGVPRDRMMRRLEWLRDSPFAYAHSLEGALADWVVLAHCPSTFDGLHLLRSLSRGKAPEIFIATPPQWLTKVNLSVSDAPLVDVIGELAAQMQLSVGSIAAALWEERVSVALTAEAGGPALRELLRPYGLAVATDGQGARIVPEVEHLQFGLFPAPRLSRIGGDQWPSTLKLCVAPADPDWRDDPDNRSNAYSGPVVVASWSDRTLLIRAPASLLTEIESMIGQLTELSRLSDAELAAAGVGEDPRRRAAAQSLWMTMATSAPWRAALARAPIDVEDRRELWRLLTIIKAKGGKGDRGVGDELAPLLEKLLRKTEHREDGRVIWRAFAPLGPQSRRTLLRYAADNQGRDFWEGQLGPLINEYATDWEDALPELLELAARVPKFTRRIRRVLDKIDAQNVRTERQLRLWESSGEESDRQRAAGLRVSLKIPLDEERTP